MAYDYSAAPEQRSLDLIPDGTVATLQLAIRPGGAGLLKRSARGDCEMLDCELIVVDGPQVKRKVWERLIVAGTTSGHEKAVEISRAKLRAIIESARGIKPGDMSPEARKGRTVEFSDFDGVRFIAKIGIEKGKPKNDGSGENYSDRNVIVAVITPDRKDWHAVEQTPRPAGQAAGNAPDNAANTIAPIAKPAWAS
jgi:hypothetical protein